eukprot:TRINITY_DN5467_c0_g1_i6.p1 TRINITY_DN5467_c0_g1~~TRINITY_DN5467_c0_g1_i6.p1  ORF type:complete len:362 (+),score=72.64 TRINITY_DN5467_c0_g1_i6:1230-2315(+)
MVSADENLSKQVAAKGRALHKIGANWTTRSCCFYGFGGLGLLWMCWITVQLAMSSASLGIELYSTSKVPTTAQFPNNSSLCPGTESFKIPKIIHQSWKSSDVLVYSYADSLHYDYKAWIQSWSKMNPDWQYVFWTDNDNRKLFEKAPALFKYRETFRKLTGINQADFSRYGYMYVFGGVYADLDFECTLPFDSLIKAYSGFLAPEPRVQTLALYGKESVVCNAIMGSRPGHPFWKALMDRITDGISNCAEDVAVQCTGPLVLQEVYEKFMQSEKEKMVKLPYELFYPEVAKYNQDHVKGLCREKNLSCDDGFKSTEPVFAFHHWTGVHHRAHQDFKYDEISSLIPSNQFRRGHQFIDTLDF